MPAPLPTPSSLSFTGNKTQLQQHLAQLAKSPYLGRGIVQGLYDKYALQVYWLTGRSASSQARHLKVEQNKLLAQTLKPIANPDQLLVYTAMDYLKQHWIVSNGRHTTALLSAIQQHNDPFLALPALLPEPDPHQTARIAAGITPAGRGWLAIIRVGASLSYTYPLTPQLAFGIHTYHTHHTQHTTASNFTSNTTSKNNVSSMTLPPFTGDPIPLPLADPQTTANLYWQHLNVQTRVGLAVRSIDLAKQTCRFYFPQQ